MAATTAERMANEKCIMVCDVREGKTKKVSKLGRLEEMKVVKLEGGAG